MRAKAAGSPTEADRKGMAAPAFTVRMRPRADDLAPRIVKLRRRSAVDCTGSSECWNDMLCKQLHLTHFLLPGHHALVEEPREPFQISVAITIDSLQCVDLSLDLIDRAGERVFRSAHPLDSPFGGRQHRACRVFLGVLRHPERLPEPEAAEVIVEPGVISIAQQRHGFLFGAAEMDRAHYANLFAEATTVAGLCRHLLIHLAQALEVWRVGGQDDWHD